MINILFQWFQYGEMGVGVEIRWVKSRKRKELLFVVKLLVGNTYFIMCVQGQCIDILYVFLQVIREYVFAWFKLIDLINKCLIPIFIYLLFI